MEKLLKRVTFIIFFIFINSMGFSGVIGSGNQSYSKEKLKKEAHAKIWSNKYSLISPIKQPKFIDADSGFLFYRYEKNKFAELNMSKIFNKPIHLDQRYWKEKYYFLLKQTTSYKTTIPKKGSYPDTYYKKPKGYNLVVVVYDVVPANKNYYSYCNVFINRKKVGRTNQALLSQKKILKLKVKTKVQHMLFVEKFALHQKKNQWERMKNLFQPKKKFFKVPKGRIRVITIVYDSYKEKPKTAHLKYQYLTHFMKKNEGINE